MLETTSWDEVKRWAEEIRRAAGHPERTEADRAAGRRRIDEQIRAWQATEEARNGPDSP